MSAILGFAGKSPLPISLERLWRALRLIGHRGLEGEAVRSGSAIVAEREK